MTIHMQCSANIDFLFSEKPAVAPSVFVFQKDKGQKVRGRRALCIYTFLQLALPPNEPSKARLNQKGRDFEKERGWQILD